MVFHLTHHKYYAFFEEPRIDIVGTLTPRRLLHYHWYQAAGLCLDKILACLLKNHLCLTRFKQITTTDITADYG
jgi:hypothetical protein